MIDENGIHLTLHWLDVGVTKNGGIEILQEKKMNFLGKENPKIKSIVYASCQ